MLEKFEGDKKRRKKVEGGEIKKSKVMEGAEWS